MRASLSIKKVLEVYTNQNGYVAVRVSGGTKCGGTNYWGTHNVEFGKKLFAGALAAQAAGKTINIICNRKAGSWNRVTAFYVR